MLDSLPKLLQTWFGNPIRGLAAVMLGLGAFLILLRFHLLDFTAVDTFLRGCVVSCLVALFGVTTYPAEHVWKWLSRKRREKNSTRNIIERLNHLTADGKHTLRSYIQDQRTTINFAPYVGVVELLAHDGVLFLLVRNPNERELLSDTYAIGPTAWQYLNSHPELVGLERR